MSMKRHSSSRSRLMSPHRISKTIWAPMHFQALKAACELRIFDPIKKGAATRDRIARAIKANPRATGMLLDELCALKLLSKSKNRYRLTDEAANFLVSDSLTSMLGFVEHSVMRQQAWGNLAKAVKKGGPVFSDGPGEREKFFKLLVRQIFPSSYATATNLAADVALPRSKDLRILDVAAGSAAWSLPFAQKHKKARVTALDFPIVLKVTREFAKRLGVHDRYEYLPGNVRGTNFGAKKYDLILLGHICHSEGAKHSKRLIAKSARALKPGGRLLIMDMVPNEERTGPRFPVAFALNMLLHTTEGDTFTFSQYRSWLRAAGLARIEQLKSAAYGCDVISAVRP